MATYKLNDKLKDLGKKKPKPMAPYQILLQKVHELETKNTVMRATLRSHESRIFKLENGEDSE